MVEAAILSIHNAIRVQVSTPSGRSGPLNLRMHHYRDREVSLPDLGKILVAEGEGPSKQAAQQQAAEAALKTKGWK